MKNKEIAMVKAALYGMKFESYGDFKKVGDVVASLDNASQALQVKHNEVFSKHGIEAVNGQYAIAPQHEKFSAINEEMTATYEEEIDLDIAFLTEEGFDQAIKVTNPIATELLIVAAKYLVK